NNKIYSIFIQIDLFSSLFNSRRRRRSNSMSRLVVCAWLLLSLACIVVAECGLQGLHTVSFRHQRDVPADGQPHSYVHSSNSDELKVQFSFAGRKFLLQLERLA